MGWEGMGMIYNTVSLFNRDLIQNVLVPQQPFPRTEPQVFCTAQPCDRQTHHATGSSVAVGRFVHATACTHAVNAQ